MSQAQFVVCSDSDALFHEAARRIVAAASAAVHARGRFTISLAGGSTPKTLYQLLATPEWKTQIDWPKVHLFFGDERMVPPDNPQSNYRMMHEALLSHVPVPRSNVHRVMTEIGSPDEVAATYEKTVRQILGSTADVPRFDFHLLGLGENGHTASLFPHRPVLHEDKKLIAADYIDEVGMYRITMTLPLLNHACIVAFLVSGSGKADIVREVVAGPYSPEDLPAQLIRLDDGELYYWLDQAAASKLPPELVDPASVPAT